MAGLDGIANKIDPGKAMDEDLYTLDERKQKKIPTVAATLEEALDALESDHKFLTAHDVFNKDMIDAYIALKRQDVETYKTAVHPIEYKMYYSA